MFYRFKSTKLFRLYLLRIFFQKQVLVSDVRLQKSNATSVDNNKSICLSEVRIPCAQRTVFNNKNVQNSQIYIVKKTSRPRACNFK